MPGTIAEQSTQQRTALYTARMERGWDVAEVIHRMRVEAKAQDAKMPTHDRTLLVHIGKWERGESVPQARYADVLTAVYGKTATELGLPDRSIPPIDSERWGRLYARYFDWTVKFLWNRVHDRELARDLAQDTWIELGKTLHKIDPSKPEDKLYGFVAQQARWTLGLYRQSSRSWRETTPEGYDDLTADLAARDDHSRPEESVRLTVDLNRVLATMPDRQRQVIVLTIFDDLSREQIARVMGLSVIQVGKIHRAAVTELRARLTGTPITWTIPSSVGALGRAA
ncbi:RNA polymerase sigma factor [Streptomyces sp. TLI_185]|uniref:RNA polymerase sigma factor n=1 Tax=Streptomyces sp. TLI_185 TaxID=2485151 RepID=UPI000F946D25|nr:sigma-70 family RNA polymerase sigma factor [Streptomyces sp. TLI_185]RPF32864.1 RNA polymerase sigma factor (sigma-70 family) [Streptomyces sp. TLI_185]